MYIVVYTRWDNILNRSVTMIPYRTEEEVLDNVSGCNDVRSIFKINMDGKVTRHVVEFEPRNNSLRLSAGICL